MSNLNIHSSKDIELFLSHVNEEAEKAAQKVFDEYQKNWEILIKNNKLKGVKLILGNGGAVYNGASSYNSNSPMSKKRDRFTTAVAQAQYTEQGAGFEAKDIK